MKQHSDPWITEYLSHRWSEYSPAVLSEELSRITQASPGLKQAAGLGDKQPQGSQLGPGVQSDPWELLWSSQSPRDARENKNSITFMCVCGHAYICSVNNDYIIMYNRVIANNFNSYMLIHM